MFYHALTGNGRTEDLEPVLLWENSSPATAFAAQTISLNLTNYAGVIVEFYDNDTRLYVKKNDTDNTAGRYTVDASYTKKVTINNNEVAISDTYVFGSQGEKNNNVLLPYKIYGVKEYVVEPLVCNIPFLRTSTSKLNVTEEQITATFDVTAFDNVDIESYLVKGNPTFCKYVIYKDDAEVVRGDASDAVHSNLHIDVSNNTKLKFVGYLSSTSSSDYVIFELNNIIFN